MLHLMTRTFSKWASKNPVPTGELANALDEVTKGHHDASLGGNLYKKRIRFTGKGKSGSGRSIVCYRKETIAIYIHGFAKNEQDNLTPKELKAFKELSKILTGLTPEQIKTALKNGDFKEVKP
jgi:hypothetical protein